MQNMKNKRGAEIINIYTPLPQIKGLWISIGVIFLLIQTPILSPKVAISSDLLILCIPCLLIDIVLIWHIITLCTQTRLIVYEDGLELQRGGSHFFNPWHNMSHFGRYHNGKFTSDGLYFYEPVKPEVNGGLIMYMPLSDFINLPARWLGFFQGATVDTVRLLNMKFGQEVYSFAPHLFETEKEKVKHGQL